MLLRLCLIFLFFGQFDGWKTLEEVKFFVRYSEEYEVDVEYPKFTRKIREMDGKEITLKGHYLPFDTEEGGIIVSKYPYSSCFFCGGAGMGSVVEVILQTKKPRLQTDEIITVKGRLKLNETDLSHLVYIIEDAKII